MGSSGAPEVIDLGDEEDEVRAEGEPHVLLRDRIRSLRNKVDVLLRNRAGHMVKQEVIELDEKDDDDVVILERNDRVENVPQIPAVLAKKGEDAEAMPDAVEAVKKGGDAEAISDVLEEVKKGSDAEAMPDVLEEVKKVGDAEAMPDVLEEVKKGADGEAMPDVLEEAKIRDHAEAMPDVLEEAKNDAEAMPDLLEEAKKGDDADANCAKQHEESRQDGSNIHDDEIIHSLERSSGECSKRTEVADSDGEYSEDSEDSEDSDDDESEDEEMADMLVKSLHRQAQLAAACSDSNILEAQRRQQNGKAAKSYQQQKDSTIAWRPETGLPLESKSSVSTKVQTFIRDPEKNLEDGLLVPSLNIRKLNKLAKKKIPDTAGAKWYNMPAQTLTPELKRELQLVKLRGVLDPKHHYKREEKKGLPKYFQIGTVVEGPADFYSSRLTRKERKATIADELLSDANLKNYRKRKYAEIMANNEAGGKKYLQQKDRRRKPAWARKLG